MRLWLGVAILIAGMGFGPGAVAEGSAEAGATKAVVCGACHGLNGNSSNPEWPNLAGQHATYTAEQLRLFKSGVRTNPIMMPLAQGLSEQDIEDLAAYYQEQKPAGLEADPSYWRAGEKLYRGGARARNIPGCIACHGPVGRGNAPARFPVLRAQHSGYTQKQLNDYAAASRYAEGNPPTGQAQMMLTIARRMTPDEIRSVASYIQGMR